MRYRRQCAVIAIIAFSATIAALAGCDNTPPSTHSTAVIETPTLAPPPVTTTPKTVETTAGAVNAEQTGNAMAKADNATNAREVRESEHAKAVKTINTEIKDAAEAANGTAGSH